VTRSPALAVLAALALTVGAAGQEGGMARGRSGPLSWEAPASIAPRVRPLSETVGDELARIEAWLGLPPAPEGRLIWVEDRAAFDAVVGGLAGWEAGITDPANRRIVIDVATAAGQGQLREILRHELVHWAMVALGEDAWRRLPAWFHEGVAENWARIDPLARFTPSLAWLAFRDELPHLSRYRDGFGREPVTASTGYALGYLFVRRLVRLHGDDVVARLLARVRAGASLDEALVAETGKSTLTLEEELRRELGSWGSLFGAFYPEFFLLVMLALAVAIPFGLRRRRRRRAELFHDWNREEHRARRRARRRARPSVSRRRSHPHRHRRHHHRRRRRAARGG